MATEIETKYEADEDTSLPRFDGLPGVSGTRGPVSYELEADYYDTTDLRLLRAGITLRRRTGGGDAGWHLKLPAAGPRGMAVRREEIQLPLGRAGRVPAELGKLVRARVRGELLVPVASITTRRQTITLLGPEGVSLAEVADDRVHATAMGDADGGRSGWREIEVELTGGDRDLLAAADKLLRRAGLRRPDRATKLERVLGRPSPAGRAPSGAQPSAAEVVTAYLREHADSLLALDPLVRRREPDAVHKMRVATRRLRSTLRSFDTVVCQPDSAPVAAELQWLGSVLGRERDAEVQAGRLQSRVRATAADVLIGPVQARIQAYVAKAAGGSHAAVVAALNSDRYLALLDALDALIAGPAAGPHGTRPAGRVMPRAVRRSYRRTRRRMEAALQEPRGPARDAALHAARKAAKRARYAAEAAIPACGPAADRFARQMKKIQSVLGDHQDTVVGRGQARQLGMAAHRAGEPAFSYGLLYGFDACAAERLESLAGQTWQHASRRRYRSWLGGR